MDYLLGFLEKLLGDPQQAGWAFALTIGVAATLFTLGALAVVLGVLDPLRRRVHAVAPDVTGARGQTGRQFARAIRPIERYVLPQNLEEQSKVRMQLVHAGYHSPSALTTFYGIKLLLTLVLAGAVILIAPLFPKLTILQVIFAAICGAALGLVVPGLVLDRRVARRQRAIMNGFPDALDLLVTCTEAGLALNAALQRVAQEISISYPALAEELALVNAAIRAGVDRVEAVRGLAERTGLEDIRGLASLLTMSMRLGTSIADTLRIYSDELRDKRMQRAEEQAAMIGTKLIFPLVFCMWPAFFVVAIGPAIIGVMRVFNQ